MKQWFIADVDFDDDLQSVAFPAGSSNASVTVPVFFDNLLEGNETFSLGLRITVRRVSASSSRGTATGIIIDSTGK